MALVRQAFACVLCCALVLWGEATAKAEESAADETARTSGTAAPAKNRAKAAKPPPAQRSGPADKEPTPQKPELALPGHRRSGAGRVANTRALRDDSKFADPRSTELTDERAVSPIAPANSLEPPPQADVNQPPPFQNPSTPPAEIPTSTFWTTLPAPKATPPQHAPSETDPATNPDRSSEETSALERDPRAAETPARTEPSQSISEPSPQATSGSPVEAGHGKNPIGTSQTSKSANKSESQLSLSPPTEGQVEPHTTVLDLIRLEIKSRLFYFQSCAAAARHRAGPEIRRLQATWFINADGTIKELKIDGMADAELTTCLIRAGSRPFPVQPGVDLTIPTPIVFVR